VDNLLDAGAAFRYVFVPFLDHHPSLPLLLFHLLSRLVQARDRLGELLAVHHLGVPQNFQLHAQLLPHFLEAPLP
jgi:hypothetical protein